MKNSVIALIIALILFQAIDSTLFAQIFKDKVDYYVGLRPYTIVSADFDNDNDIDLAAAPQTEFNGTDGIGWVTILMNNGDGTFTLSDSIAVGDGPNITAADLDNDDDIDLVASDYFTDQIYIIINNGSGVFTVADSFSSGGQSSHLLCAADLDNDGDFDLAVPNSVSNDLSVFFNNGDATFTLPPTTYPVGSFPIAAISGDLDNDADSDLIVTVSDQRRILVLLNDGSGAFLNGANYSINGIPYAPSLADYNGDGCLDLSVPNVYSDVYVLTGNCDGTFNSNAGFEGCAPHANASGDFDRDGDIDMASVNNECNSVSIYLNNGDGTFMPQVTFTTGTGPNGITTNDFNDDGYVDLAIADFDNDTKPGNSVSVFINNLYGNIYAINTKTDKKYIETSGDSLKITTNFRNDYDHEFTSKAIYFNSDSSFSDSVSLYDDGMHGDMLSGDGIWGGYISSIPGEDFFKIVISTIDNQTSKYSNFSTDLISFTTAGPIEVDSMSVTSVTSTLYRIKPYLKNKGHLYTVENLKVILSTDDNSITNISNTSLSFASISPGETVAPTSNIYVTVDSTFSGVFNFDFEIMSEGRTYWTDSITQIVTDVKDKISLPVNYRLYQNFPNPFNPSTTFNYSIPEQSKVVITVYDILGNEIETLVNEEKIAGTYEVTFDAGNLSSGIYFYKIQVGEFVESKKMVLLK